MNYTFKMIRRVAGKNIKSLYLPIVLSCVDALLHMGMFSTMIMTIIELIGGVFTMQRLTLYGVILVLLFLMRAILFSINYTQVQYRGADISAQQRLSNYLCPLAFCSGRYRRYSRGPMIASRPASASGQPSR